MAAVSNLFSLFFLPLFLAASSSPLSSTSSPSPSSKRISAANLLPARGYSVFASILAKASTTLQTENWTAAGTLFAPTDASFSSEMLENAMRGPPLLASSFLPYHTTRQRLLFQDLALQPDGSGLPTFYNWRCVFLFRSTYGDLFLSPTKNTTSGGYIRIRDPNIFSNLTLVIHGVDGILDTSAASICTSWPDEPPESEYPRVAPPVADFYLGHALQALGENGYGLAATALGMWRSELIPLPGTTVFAPADQDAFSGFYGFSYYDLCRHVLPRRLAFFDLASLPNGTILATMAPGEAAFVGTSNSAVTVNDVPVGWPDIYHNEWIVVYSVPRLLPIYAVTGTSDPEDQDPAGFHGSSAPSPAATDFDLSTGESPTPSVGIEWETTASAPTPYSSSDSGGPAPSPASPFPAPPHSDSFAGAAPLMGSEGATAASAPSPRGSLSHSSMPATSPAESTPESPSYIGFSGETPAPPSMAISAPALAPVLPPSAHLLGDRLRGGVPPSPRC
ncbi:hypothetical protein ACLOJK_034113 [Asimina triloba]